MAGSQIEMLGIGVNQKEMLGIGVNQKQSIQAHLRRVGQQERLVTRYIDLRLVESILDPKLNFLLDFFVNPALGANID